MPNWVSCNVVINGTPKKIEKVKKALFTKGESKQNFTTRLSFELFKLNESTDADEIRKAVRKMLTETKDDIAFDFNGVIKMPEHSDNFNADEPVGDDRMGGNNWYDWSCENWGTKWNSNESELVNETSKSLEYNFQTAWSAPIKVIEALAKKFKVEVEIKFYDEDIGSNCGRFSYDNKGNEIENEYYNCRSNESMDFIDDNFPDTLDGYGYVRDESGQWKYEEEEESEE